MPPKRRVRGPPLPALPESPDRQEDPIDEVDPMESPDRDDDRDNQRHRNMPDYMDDDFDNDEEETSDGEDVQLIEQEHDTNVYDDRTIQGLEIRMRYTKVTPDMTGDQKMLVQTGRLVKKGVIDSVRQAFQARDNIGEELIIASQKMIVAFKRANNTRHKKWNLVKEFFMELDARLVMMFEEVTVAENRARVYKMVAMVAIELLVLGYNQEFFHFVLGLVESWSESESVASRINASCCVSYIFETGKTHNRQLTGENFSGFPLEGAYRLFAVLKRALLDKEASARIPAIKGMGVIQNCAIPSAWPVEGRESSARELLTRSCRDMSWECRLVAIQSFMPRDEDLQLVSDIAYYDKSTIVRVAALEQLGKMRPHRDCREKVVLVDMCFKDHEPAVRDAAKMVLREWVARLARRYVNKAKQQDVVPMRGPDDEEAIPPPTGKGYILAGQGLCLLWLVHMVDSMESHLNLRRMMTHLLDVIRHMYLCHAEPISTFAEQIVVDLKETQPNCPVPLVTKSTIDTLLVDNPLNADNQDTNTTRAMVMFWRCLVEYMSDRARNEGDKFHAMSRFTHPLGTMCESLETFLNRVKEEEVPPSGGGYHEGFEDDVYVVQMSIMENYLPVLKYCQQDQSGLDAYKQLLISMLMNPFYQKKVMDIIVQELGQFYKDDPHELFSLICARTSEMRDKYDGYHFPVLEGTVLIGEQKFRRDWRNEIAAGGTPKKKEKDLVNRHIDQYEIKVLNCCLKLALLKEWIPEYDDRYREKLRAQTKAKDDSTKICAIECLGIIGCYDFDLVADDFREMADFHFQKLARHDPVTPEEHMVQASVVLALADMFVENPDKYTDKLYEPPLEHWKNAENTPTFFADIICSDQHKSGSEILVRTVEALCRTLLNSKIDPTCPAWQRCIVTLMYRASFKITDHYSARLRSTILVTLQFFCSMNQRNQLVVVRSFRRFFSLWTNTADVGLLTENRNELFPKLKRCAHAFAALTRHTVLPADMQKNFQPSHIELFDDILDEIHGRSATNLVDFYLAALPHIEFESFSRQVLTKYHTDLQCSMELNGEDMERSHRNEIRRVQRKIAKLLGLNMDDGDIEEMPSTVSELRPTRRTAKATATLDGIQEEDNEDSDDDNQPGPSTVKPKRTRAAPTPRKAPASAQKKSRKDAEELMASPPVKAGKKPSRPTTATRPSSRTASATPMRTMPPRSARRLN
ncbi:hypothetical protein L5515_000036 [Caenorhabditis briggsae]|uniref:Nuclear condensin complex subunit 3 C-terminal domain-containing protein n=2 Tax=Caenorhabditis briggsae TaxID=6238 RepID=A0AAE9DQ84_CAEBR|nr:hypothetical protein L3Y34_013942 [Caenorhabditis briggsae]UMM10120.1 hypothetical protein L5515_000036 [Caenorhabditis briggsae]